MSGEGEPNVGSPIRGTLRLRATLVMGHDMVNLLALSRNLTIIGASR
jgi:hypothetical protein